MQILHKFLDYNHCCDNIEFSIKKIWGENNAIHTFT